MFNISHGNESGLGDDQRRDGEGRPVLKGALLGRVTKRGKERAAENNVMPTGVGFCSYGWDYDAELRQMVVNPDEAANVLWALEMLDAGATISGLVRLFNEQGIPAKRGGRWGYASMRNMVTNPALKGDYYWGKTRTVRGDDGVSVKKVDVPKDEWKRIDGFLQGAIASNELFDRVQTKIEERGRKAGLAKPRRWLHPQ